METDSEKLERQKKLNVKGVYISEGYKKMSNVKTLLRPFRMTSVCILALDLVLFLAFLTPVSLASTHTNENSLLTMATMVSLVLT